MVAHADRAGRIVKRLMPRRTRSPAIVIIALSVFPGLLGVLYLGRVIAPCADQTMAITMLGLAGLGGLGGFAALAAYRVNGVLATRLNLLSSAVDAAEPLLIVAPDGRSRYSNVAFDRLFPLQERPPLDRIKHALCPDAESQLQFRRLCSRAAAGARAAAT